MRVFSVYIGNDESRFGNCSEQSRMDKQARFWIIMRRFLAADSLMPDGIAAANKEGEKE